MFDKYLTKTGKLSASQPQEVKNQWYINKFQEVHGDTYNYSQVIYITSKIKVAISCKEHGLFWQAPNTHLKGHGCPKCYYSSKVKTTEQCIKDFRQVHKNTYDYSKVVYISCMDEVDIYCAKHGKFAQTPHSHLQGNGCPKCQSHNQNTLYILRCKDTGLVKIGITNNLKKRMSSIGGNLEYIFSITVDNPRQLEKQLHSQYQQYSVPNPKVRSGGTEFFNLTLEQVQEIICSLQVRRGI